MKRDITIEDLVATISSCRTDSDLHLLERHYENVRRGRLEDDALLFYGIHIQPDEKGEAKYAVAFIDQVEKRGLAAEARMRGGTEKARRIVADLRESWKSVRAGVAKTCSEHYPQESEIPGVFHELLRRLDATAGQPAST
jgi:hypothetical protein